MTKEEFLIKQKQEIVKKNVFQLTTEYKNNQKTVHCFYEGKDNVFYRGFINNVFYDYKYYFYSGSGKESVMKSYKNIKNNLQNWNNYNKNRILFFIDKDVDDFIGKSVIKDENIFETKYYSIENYLVNEDVFERILTETFELVDDIKINTYKSLFKENLEKFHKNTIYISSWIIYNRKENYSSPLKKVKMNDLFLFEYANNIIELKLKSDYIAQEKIHEYLKEKTKMSDEICLNSSDINSIKDGLNSEPKLYTRGKFELWFFIEFYNTFNKKLIDDYNKNT